MNFLCQGFRKLSSNRHSDIHIYTDRHDQNLHHAVSRWVIKYVDVLLVDRRGQRLLQLTAVRYQPLIQPVTAYIAPAHRRRIYLRPILTPRITSLLPSRIPHQLSSLATRPHWPYILLLGFRNVGVPTFLNRGSYVPRSKQRISPLLYDTSCMTVCLHHFVAKLPAPFAVENSSNKNFC